ncbi:DNA-binding MarR family transcriptional regulator [Crossiella equi]|uniref:DNA-binding MarR family transcriptional regulator n=1 Tax=Crossiella equi TaxID=130796 RepID=A0ABS5A5W7_9PSEU|nr:MarR family transcriptional regulator [Crossiella equi]MBP2471995.1 DNA-binding MarR family transcriptional regulator [Crossiella equi]
MSAEGEHGGAEPSFSALDPTTLLVQRLVNGSRELTARMARRLNVNTTDMSALSLLEQFGPMGTAELAERLGLRVASTTSLIDRLERAGHVRRGVHETDRRRIVVRSTPSAHRASLALLLPSIEGIDSIGKALSPHEREVVAGYLDSVLRVMYAAPAAPDALAEAPPSQ